GSGSSWLWNSASGATLTAAPVVSGVLSFPVSPSILASTAFSDPSRWSKERFSIMRTTICLRLSSPGGIRVYSCNLLLDEWVPEGLLQWLTRKALSARSVQRVSPISAWASSAGLNSSELFFDLLRCRRSKRQRKVENRAVP